jgi:hypothetical protein
MKSASIIVSELRARGVLEIVEAIARDNGCTIVELVSHSRTYHIKQARAEAWRQIKTRKRWSSKAIGAVFGFDHTTVLDALRGRKSAQRATADDIEAELASRGLWAVTEVVAGLFGVLPGEVVERPRTKRARDARHALWDVLMTECKMGADMLAKMFGVDVDIVVAGVREAMLGPSLAKARGVAEALAGLGRCA